MITIEDRAMPILRINAPDWYRDQEFLRWLNSPGTATWHMAGSAPSEGSDVFFTFNDGEGSDYPGIGELLPGIPQRIWEQLERLVAERFGSDAEVLVWVSNLEQ